MVDTVEHAFVEPEIERATYLAQDHYLRIVAKVKPLNLREFDQIGAPRETSKHGFKNMEASEVSILHSTRSPITSGAIRDGRLRSNTKKI